MAGNSCNSCLLRTHASSIKLDTGKPADAQNFIHAFYVAPFILGIQISEYFS